METLKSKPIPPFRPLRGLAERSRFFSYVPYSNYHVGAAVETIGGHFYGGCGNQENQNFTLTKHAEETAILDAISSGAMMASGKLFLKTIYLVPAINAEGEYVEHFPCGNCRQFAQEYAAPGAQWCIEQLDGSTKYYSFDDLLPFPYSDDSETITQVD